jgi:hypothetical protein
MKFKQQAKQISLVAAKANKKVKGEIEMAHATC